MKVSAVKPEHHVVEARARVFHDQESVKRAFKAGEFTEDTVVVVRFQGPRANGMPELHSPEAAMGGPIAKVRDGDRLRVDAVAGTIEVLEEGFEARAPATADLSANAWGHGREMFEVFRQSCGLSSEGAGVVV